jgi:hypothetical protein
MPKQNSNTPQNASSWIKKKKKEREKRMSTTGDKHSQASMITTSKRNHYGNGLIDKAV